MTKEQVETQLADFKTHGIGGVFDYSKNRTLDGVTDAFVSGDGGLLHGFS